MLQLESPPRTTDTKKNKVFLIRCCTRTRAKARGIR